MKNLNQKNVSELLKIYLNTNKEVSNYKGLYLDYLLPYSLEYTSSVKASFLLGSKEFDFLNSEGPVIIRDGFIPLSYFFYSHSPMEFGDNIKLIINYKFYNLVPKIWRPFVSFYSIYSNNYLDSNFIPKKMILAGVSNETMLKPEDFAIKCHQVGKLFDKKNLNNIEVTAYFPNKRSDVWGRWREENYYQYPKMLFKNLKLDINFPVLSSLLDTVDCEDTLYVEFNSGILCADSFLEHFFLSRGALILKNKIESNKKFELVNKIQLSKHHFFHIYNYKYENGECEVDLLKTEEAYFFKKILSKGYSPKEYHEGWESWFGEFILKNMNSANDY